MNRRTAEKESYFAILTQSWVPYVLLALTVFAAYGNVYGNLFLFDDDTLIIRNQFLRGYAPLSSIFLTSIGGGSGAVNDFYRPMQILLYVLIAQAGDIAPFGFHLLNVSLHMANVCLLYALGCKLGFRPLAVFLGALLWGLHPIQTEAVTYMSATADPLYSFFCLLGVLVLLPDFAPRRMAIACFCFVLGLLSKETAAVFPLLAASCLFFLSERRGDIKTYMRLWPLLIIAALYYVLRKTVLDVQAMDVTFQTNPYYRLYAGHILYRFYSFFATVPFYGMLLVWPMGLHLERQFPVYGSPLCWEVITGFFTVLMMLMYIVWGQRRKPSVLGWGLMWFGAAYSLYSGILVPLNAIFLEHWMYLPTAGLFVGLSEALAALIERQHWRKIGVASTCVAFLVAGAYGVATWNQNEIWRDAFILYPTILRYEPSVRALTNLGKAYLDRADYDNSLKYLHAAVRLRDVTPETHQNIAFVLTHEPGAEKHTQEAIEELKRAIEIDPNFLPAYEGLLYLYGQIGDAAEAAHYREKASALRQRLTNQP